MRILSRNSLVCTLILLCPVFVGAQQALEAIDLQAETSSYDRQNGHLVFTRVNITQGGLSISAALAEATELQFDDSSWRFSGDVRIVLEEATIVADEALIEFAGHKLQSATLTGDPTTIESNQQEGEKRVEGRATRMEYDHVEKTLRLVGDAWVSEGQNEISGSSMLYDFDTETIIAGDPQQQSQDVRIIIKPPETDLEKRIEDRREQTSQDDADSGQDDDDSDTGE